MSKTILALVLGILLSGAAKSEEAAPVVAVFDIENRGSPLTAEDLSVLTDLLANKLGEGGIFRIVPRNEIRARLREEQKASHKECYDRSCQIDIGRELAAGYTVSTAIARMGNTCLITAAMYDLEKAASFKSATGKASCQVDALVGELEKVAEKLAGKAPAAKPTRAPAPAPAPPPAPGPRKPSFSIAPPVAKKVEPPSHLLEFLALVINRTVVSGRDLPEADNAGVAVGIQYDYRLKSIFTLGAGLRLHSDVGLLETALRGGLLFQLSRRWLLHTYLQVGYAYAWELYQDDSLRGISSHGFSARAGAGIKWLIFDFLGIGFDLSFAALYANVPDLADESWLLSGDFGFGGIFVW